MPRPFALLLVLLAPPPAVPRPSPALPQEGEEAPPAMNELEQEFAATLTAAQLVGAYTDSALPEDAPPQRDRYTIYRVAKIGPDLWRFDVRIQYGERDVTLPIPLEVKWAGDTPVITLRDLTLPKLGTFSARVLVHRGQYAGTWSGGDHHGQLFGRIQKLPETLEEPETEGAPPRRDKDADGGAAAAGGARSAMRGDPLAPPPAPSRP